MRSAFPEIGFVAIGALLLILVVTIHHLANSTAANSRKLSTDTALFQEPVAIYPSVRPLYPQTSRQGRLLSAILTEPPVLPMNGPALAHAAQIYGPNRVLYSSTGPYDPVSVLTSSILARKHLNEPLVMETRHGIRYHLVQRTGTRRHGESHRDLFLATFAQLRIPLAHPIVTDTGTFAIKDLLRDSVATFHLSQTELPWTAVAYAYYLAPHVAWRNHEGTRFSFDDLCGELLRRPMAGASCGGVHLLYAITILLRADHDSPLLSTQMRRRAHAHIEHFLQLAVDSQVDGSFWSPAWHTWPVPTPRLWDSESARFVVTAHMLEWFTYLPPLFHPPDHTVRGTAEWLTTLLPSIDPASGAHICPWAHAVLALRHLVRGMSVNEWPMVQQPGGIERRVFVRPD